MRVKKVSLYDKYKHYCTPDSKEIARCLERVRREMLTGEPETELRLALTLSGYMKNNYPNLEFRFDYAGLSTAKKGRNGLIAESVQSKIMKTLNKRKGWPDFELFLSNSSYTGLVLELKRDGEKIRRSQDAKQGLITHYNYIGKNKNRTRVPVREVRIRKAGDYKDLHIEEQAECLMIHSGTSGKAAGFTVGLERTLVALEAYINGQFQLLNHVIEI